MPCQNLGRVIAAQNDGNIARDLQFSFYDDEQGKQRTMALTDVEQQAIVDARYQLAQALTDAGLMQHFENLDAAVIDKITTAVVIGFQASVHRQCSKGEVPF